MCDLLKKSALAYRELAHYEYMLTCGRKGVQARVVLRFPINAYHHLAGFQYARLAALREQKSALDIQCHLVKQALTEEENQEKMVC